MEIFVTIYVDERDRIVDWKIGSHVFSDLVALEEVAIKVSEEAIIEVGKSVTVILGIKEQVYYLTAIDER